MMAIVTGMVVVVVLVLMKHGDGDGEGAYGDGDGDGGGDGSDAGSLGFASNRKMIFVNIDWYPIVHLKKYRALSAKFGSPYC